MDVWVCVCMCVCDSIGEWVNPTGKSQQEQGEQEPAAPANVYKSVTGTNLWELVSATEWKNLKVNSNFLSCNSESKPGQNCEKSYLFYSFIPSFCINPMCFQRELTCFYTHKICWHKISKKNYIFEIICWKFATKKKKNGNVALGSVWSLSSSLY